MNIPIKCKYLKYYDHPLLVFIFWNHHVTISFMDEQRILPLAAKAYVTNSWGGQPIQVENIHSQCCDQEEVFFQNFGVATPAPPPLGPFVTSLSMLLIMSFNLCNIKSKDSYSFMQFALYTYFMTQSLFPTIAVTTSRIDANFPSK